MKLGIMQPYFMPYIGYFQLMKAVDKYVIYDDVNYIKRGWINRNNILENGEKKLFTISLHKASQNKLINEIEIEDDFQKFLKTIQMNYRKAPYYSEIISLIERIVSFPDKNLARFLTNSFREILSYLSIDTELLVSSRLQKDCSLKGSDKILHICKLLGADTYYNAIGGQELYDKEEFAKNGIQLHFLQTAPISYPQFNQEFVPYLSIIDVLMFNSPEKVNKLLDEYTLI